MTAAKLIAELAPALLGAALADVSKTDPDKAKELEATALPIIERLTVELAHDEDQKQRRSRAQLVASLAVDLVDSVVIPDDVQEAKAMARKAVLMASFVLDAAAELHGVEVEAPK